MKHSLTFAMLALARPNAAPMPGWAAGAHIDVHLPDVGRRHGEKRRQADEVSAGVV